MAARASVVAGHIIAEACSATALSAGLESPTGRSYPQGTPASLRGNMEPVVKETSGKLELIYGVLPHDLDGKFIRTGPNSYLDMYARKNSSYHEFEADAMLHACDLHNGIGTYRNRWVETKKLKMDKTKGKPSRKMAYYDEDGIHMGAANTAVVYHAKKLLAVFETDRPYAISPSTLETVGYQTYGGTLKHNMTAHPKVCPETKELVFFGYDLMAPVIHYGVVSAEGDLVRSFDIPTQSGKSVMMHDMVITKRFSILFEFPLFFNMERAMEGNMPFSLDADSPTMIAILPRHAKTADEVKWFKAKSAYTFHFVNAWEDGHTIKVVGCAADSFSFDYAGNQPFQLREWTIDLQTGTVSERQIHDANVEFPQVNPTRMGKWNRYAWASHFTGGVQEAPPFFTINGCVKYDFEAGSFLRHNFKDGRFGGECVFAPRVGGVDEDDGYLVTYTFNPKDLSTDVYVVNAKTMSPDPVAILRTPQRVPFGFHATWLPRADC